MSHPHSEINLSEGLTVLTGPNNCGKSAIVGALDVLCNNLSGNFMVRHGANDCYVSIELNDDDVVTWRRRGKTTSYEINGREVHRLGKGGIPDDLHTILRMPQIQHPGRQSDPFEIHLAHQKSPIFLLDQPGSRAAMFFASSSDAEKLLRMQQRHRQKVRDARQILAQKISTKNALTAKEAILQPVKEIETLAKITSTEQQELTKLSQRIEQAKQLLQHLDLAEVRQERIAHRLNTLKILQIPPKLNDSSALEKLIVRNGSAYVLHEKAASIDGVISCLTQPPQLANTNLLTNLIINLDGVSQLTIKLEKKAKTLNDLTAPPELLHVTTLKTLIGKIFSAKQRARDGTRLTETLNPVTAPPSFSESAAMHKSMLRLQHAERQFNNAYQYLEIMADLPELPSLAEQESLRRFIEKLAYTFNEVSRLQGESDQLTQVITAVLDTLNQSELTLNVEATSRKLSSGVPRSTVIVASVFLLIGASIWMALNTSSPISAIFIKTQEQSATSETQNGESVLKPIPSYSDDSTRSSRVSDQLTESYIESTLNSTYDPLLDQEIQTPSTSLKNHAPPEEKISALESDRMRLIIKIQELEQNIAGSQKQLNHVREKLVIVESSLSRLRGNPSENSYENDD